MSDRTWVGGKGDKSRISDMERYRNNYDNIFKKEHKSWTEYSNEFMEKYPEYWDLTLDDQDDRNNDL